MTRKKQSQDALESSQFMHSHTLARPNFLMRYMGKQAYAFMVGLSHLWRSPLSTLMTTLVLGISLALPMILYVFLQNVHVASGSFKDSTQISVYLNNRVSDAEAQALITQMRQNSEIIDTRYISPAEGLKQFQQQAGFGDALDHLQNNPLPGVIEVQPAPSLKDANDVKQLMQQLQTFQGVDNVVLDMMWVKRMYAMLQIANNFVTALAVILGLAVILIIGNTIRLSVQRHHDEIEVTKLVGGTNAFIRRPYLYMGLLYGLFGAVVAYLIINGLLYWLSMSVQQLASLYNSNFRLQAMSAQSLIALFCVAVLLGWCGAWLAVNRQIERIEPK